MSSLSRRRRPIASRRLTLHDRAARQVPTLPARRRLGLPKGLSRDVLPEEWTAELKDSNATERLLDVEFDDCWTTVLEEHFGKRRRLLDCFGDDVS